MFLSDRNIPNSFDDFCNLCPPKGKSNGGGGGGTMGLFPPSAIFKNVFDEYIFFIKLQDTATKISDELLQFIYSLYIIYKI